MLDLQRSVGNRAVSGLLAPAVSIQTTPMTPTTTADPTPTPAAASAISRPAAQPLRAGQQPVVQRFEAQHHEHVERGALTAPVEATGGGPGGPGFSDAEATATYFGNWSRDLSQVLGNNPLVRVLGADLVFEIVNAMAMQKFGRTLNPADFGVYSPREHIDNPAGQINADLLRRDLNVRIHGNEIGTDEDIGGGGGGSPAERTERLRERINEQFTVNAAGLPAYLGASTQYVEQELSTSADLGRQNPDALMHLGNGLHTVEDLFAHSNFVEIAAGKLFQAGRLPLPPETRTQLEGRKCDDPSHRDNGHPLDAIDAMGGKTASGRPILVTGSFVTADTKLSIAEALAAFLAELSPFGAGNRERSQDTVRLLLGRYETLAETGKAGEMISTALGNIGGELTTKLAQAAEQAVAGERPAEGAGFWSRAASTLRGAAGSVVGAGLRAVGGVLSWDWVRDAIGSGVNQFGRLPLVRTYEFVTKQTNAVDDFFKGIDQRLRAFPFYLNTVKPWLDRSRDSLRESLKGVIEGALKFMAQLLQSGFVEQRVQDTNIARQIESQIASEVQNPTARAELQAAGPEERISMLMNPAWCVAARIDVVTAERIASMQMAPEYIQAAASHSQIAKDHADSPFFGTAAALASHADTQLRDKMIAVWTAEGQNRTSPDLAANYADEASRVDPYYAARRPPPGKPESEWTQDERIAERHAQQDMPHYGELNRRHEGEQLRDTGAFPEAEEDHGGEAAYAAIGQTLAALSREAGRLPEQLTALADRMSDAAPDGARRLREIAAAFPGGITELADQVSAATDHEAVEKLADRARALAAEKNGLVAEVQQLLTDTAARIESTDPALDALAQRLRTAATTIAPAMRVVADRLARAAEGLVPQDHLMGAEQRKALHELAPVATSDWSADRAASAGRPQPGAAGMSPERAAMFEFVRSIFGHPYDTDWYEPTLISWCEANQERLAAYIASRNRGEMHHHPH